MDHDSHMAMGTSSAAMPSGTAGASMAGHGGMDMGGSCRISMLWNWYTIDACFINSSWRITSSGMFAGSCIGVILLVMLLELLRRVQREYDRLLYNQHVAALSSARSTSHDNAAAADAGSSSESGSSTGPTAHSKTGAVTASTSAIATLLGNKAAASSGSGEIRPTLVQQLVRALIHTAQFAVAYFVMLLAMYYNGYIIICIFIGAFIGYFVFSWTGIGNKPSGSATEVTGCCG